MGGIFYGDMNAIAADFGRYAYPTESYMLIGNTRKKIYVATNHKAMWLDKERNHASAGDEKEIIMDGRLIGRSRQKE